MQMRVNDEQTEQVLCDFMTWLADEGWIKDDLLDQAVDIAVSDFVHGY